MTKLKSFFILITLSLIVATASADLSADKTELNKNTGKAIVTVSFPTPVKGDLYLVVNLNGQLLFFADSGKTISPNAAPYKRDTSFSQAFEILTVSADGVPPGTYSLYEAVIRPNTDPFDVKNWIGGFAGLSSLDFKINLPQVVATVTPQVVATVTPPVTTPVKPVVPPTTTTDCLSAKVRAKSQNDSDNSDNKENAEAGNDVNKGDINQKAKDNEDGKADEEDGKADEDENNVQPQPTQVSCTSVSTSSLVTTGKTIYKKLCSACHGTNPAANQNNILKGRDASKIRSAIKDDKGGVMGVLGNISDADLQAVAEYLKAL